VRDLAKNLAVRPAFDQPIVIYCAAGHRGAIAETALVLLGYQNVTSLRGGIKGYTGALSQDVPAVTTGEFPAVDADVWATVDAYLSALPAGFSTISAEDLSLALPEGGLFLGDVREASEYAQGFIEGAVNLPMRGFGEVLGSLPSAETPIVVYDSSGHRSAVVMAALQMAGFADVRSYPGGTAAWVAGGMTLVTP
jgi:rhodanese-related sulfurtransferase